MESANTYLATKGYIGRPAPNGETLYPCFLGCQEPADSRKRKLYVKEDGIHNCFVCGSKGGMKTLREHFGDPWEYATGSPIPRRGAVLRRATNLAAEALTRNDDAMMYLLGDKRCLTPEEIVENKFGWVDPYWSLSAELRAEGFTDEDLAAGGILDKFGKDFYRGHILIPYFHDGKVVQLRGKDPNGRYYTASGDRVRVYGSDDAVGAKDVLVVEGEFDRTKLKGVLQAAEDPRVANMAVVGLPGVNALPEDFEQLTSTARRIFLGTDPDTAGREGGERLAALIGSRARMLKWPDFFLDQAQADGLPLKEIDWSVWIGRYGATWQMVAAMLREASGRRLATMAEAGHRYRNQPKGLGLRTGFAELDAWLEPGLLPGQVVVPIAKTGTGKTVFLCNLAYNMRFRRVLFVTLEMTAEEIYMRMARIFRFYNPRATSEEVELALSNILICDENRLSESDFAELIEEYEIEKGERPECVLVDYLGYYARGAKGGSPYEKVSNAVMQLKAEAKTHHCVVVAPHQVSRGAKEGQPIEMDDARDSGVVEETADFMISIFRPDDALDIQRQPSGKIRMEILKSRHGNKGKITTLQMGLLSLVLVDTFAKEKKQAEHECFLVHRGETYDRYMKDRAGPVQTRMVTS